jgi:hypothetical protein
MNRIPKSEDQNIMVRINRRVIKREERPLGRVGNQEAVTSQNPNGKNISREKGSTLSQTALIKLII